MNDVITVIQLKMEGGMIRFYVHDVFLDSISCTIYIDIDKGLRDISVQSNKMYIYFSDIDRLSSYLKEMVLDKKEILEADTFVTQNLDFQFTILDGEILPSNNSHNSYCSINFMINLGATCEEFSNSYVGLESTVLISEIQNFYDNFSNIIHLKNL